MWELPDSWLQLLGWWRGCGMTASWEWGAENQRGPQKRPQHLDMDQLLQVLGSQVTSVLLEGPGKLCFSFL